VAPVLSSAHASERCVEPDSNFMISGDKGLTIMMQQRERVLVTQHVMLSRISHKGHEKNGKIVRFLRFILLSSLPRWKNNSWAICSQRKGL
jgi:hypothetical protein